MERDPRVSIVLATYNERENILDTISSIFEHVKDSTEVIVVDDDSSDKTWQLVEELNDPRVKLIRRVETRGLASAFNRGVIESRGEVVGWMDADMCMPPSLLPDMISKLDEYDIVVGS
ncbi:MAG: glycosyltransferase, partial [Pseudomonadota bacterium]